MPRTIYDVALSIFIILLITVWLVLPGCVPPKEQQKKREPITEKTIKVDPLSEALLAKARGSCDGWVHYEVGFDHWDKEMTYKDITCIPKGASFTLEKKD